MVNNGFWVDCVDGVVDTIHQRVLFGFDFTASFAVAIVEVVALLR